MLNDTDDTWHHDTLLAIVSKNNKISGGFIREPQWKILTFALSIWEKWHITDSEKAYRSQRETKTRKTTQENH